MTGRAALPDSDRGRVLRALGYSPLMLRDAAGNEPAPQAGETGRIPRSPDTANRSPRLCLLLAEAEAHAADGRLLAHLLRALGLRPEQVRFEPQPDLPQLKLQVPLATLARDAQAKRALWPELRAWRRRLPDGNAGQVAG